MFVFCLDCEQKITLESTPDVGNTLCCPICGAEMEVVKIEPIELDWTYHTCSAPLLVGEPSLWSDIYQSVSKTTS